VSSKTRKQARRRQAVHHVNPASRARRQQRLAKSSQHMSTAAIAMAHGSRDVSVQALELASKAARYAGLLAIGGAAQFVIIIALLIWR
jgi:hypothetical protein